MPFLPNPRVTAAEVEAANIDIEKLVHGGAGLGRAPDGRMALIAGALTLMYETPSLEGIRACMGSLLYAAVCSGAIGYTLQIAGQKYLEPAPASLLLCLESVFAALGGWIFLHDALSARELLGCALMFGATIIALMPRYHAHESK